MTPPTGPWPPPYPPGGLPPHPRPIRGGRVAIGIASAIGAHLLSIAIGIGIAATGNGLSDAASLSLLVILIGQFVVFVVCLAVGITLLARGDRGIGLGLLIGWAVGVIVLPVVGFGVCVAILSGQGAVR